MSIRLLNFDLHILNMHNRMPFRYRCWAAWLL